MPITTFPASSGGGGGDGTVTSVGLSSTDLSISGSPVTVSGNITANIANNAVTTAKINNGAVTADKLASDSVITAKILNKNVTLGKIQDIATDRVLGRVTAESGEIEILTATQIRTLISVEENADVTDLTNVLASLNTIGSIAEGDILYRNDTGWVRLARGTDNQVLTATASTINWETPASGFADPMTTEGDIIYRTSGGVTTRLGKGTDGQVLTATADSINWENPSGGGNTWDGTLTQATTGFDLAGKNVKITATSTISLNTIFDFTNMTNLSESRVEVLCDTGAGAIDITTTSLNTFGDTWEDLPDTKTQEFLVYKDFAGVVKISALGVYP
jgi:hypothetical protein